MSPARPVSSLPPPPPSPSPSTLPAPSTTAPAAAAAAPHVVKHTVLGEKFCSDGHTFISSSGAPLHRWDFADYRLITDAEEDPNARWSQIAPAQLKPLLEPRWHYAIHLQDNLKSPLTEDVMRSRVMGGQILSYCFTPCAIGLKNAIYYGYMPASPETDPDSTRFTHKTPLLAGTTAGWPRRIYIVLHRGGRCKCGADGCRVWIHWMPHETKRYCGRAIPWASLYVLLGETVAADGASPDGAPPRNCPVCAQCFACATSAAAFCRKHIRCNHQQAITNRLKTAAAATATATPSAPAASTTTATTPPSSTSNGRKRKPPPTAQQQRTLMRSKIKDCTRLML